jgi:hypothetical protein
MNKFKRRKHQPHIMIVIVAVAAIIIGNFIVFAGRTHNLVTSYTDCVNAGYPVQETFPERCVTPEGTSFTNVASSTPDPISPTTSSNHSITAVGTIGCHMKPDTAEPQTLECALGLDTDDGKHYALSTDDNSLFMQPASSKVSVTGGFKSATDQKYVTNGTIMVSSWKAVK